MEPAGKEYEKAIAYIRELISTREIVIGSRLPSEREIAATLAISRNSIREALRMLENVGIIESRQGCGNFLCGNVARSFSTALDILLLLHKTDTEDICRFRRSIEKAVYDLACQGPDAQTYLPHMRRVLDAFPGSPLEKQVELDKEFHYLLVRAAGNQLLGIIMDALSDIYQEWVAAVLHRMSQSDMHRLHQAHTAIYESLLTGDRERGTRAIDEHYSLIEWADPLPAPSPGTDGIPAHSKPPAGAERI